VPSDLIPRFEAPTNSKRVSGQENLTFTKKKNEKKNQNRTENAIIVLRVRDVFLMTHCPALRSGATIFWVAAVENGARLSGRITVTRIIGKCYIAMKYGG